MARFVNKKVAEIDTLYQANTKIWLVQFFYFWCGKNILAQVGKN